MAKSEEQKVYGHGQQMTSMQSHRHAKSHQCCQSHRRGESSPKYLWMTEVSHELSRLSDILFTPKSLLYTHHRACSTSPCRLSCPPGLAVCCSQRRLNHRQAWDGLPERRLRVLLLSGQREGAQLYQQEPSVPVLMLGNERLDGERSQEMNSPVETGTGRDHSFHPPMWFASVSCINFTPTWDSCLPWGRKPTWNAEQECKVCNGPVGRGAPPDTVPSCCLAIWVLPIIVLPPCSAYVHCESSCWHLIP